MKIKYSHTPGPWRVSSGAVETADGIPIAYMDRETGNGTVPVERDENARLIAAAPDLLEAAQDLRDAIIEHNFDDILHVEVSDLCAAIARAEGRD